MQWKISLNRWMCKSTDNKTAFLQGKHLMQKLTCALQRLMYHNVSFGNGQKCIYRLSDATCVQYLRIRKVLIKLDTLPSECVQAIFRYIFFTINYIKLSLSNIDNFCFIGSKVSHRSALSSFSKLNKKNQPNLKYICLNIQEIWGESKTWAR